LRGQGPLGSISVGAHLVEHRPASHECSAQLVGLGFTRVVPRVSKWTPDLDGAATATAEGFIAQRLGNPVLDSTPAAHDYQDTGMFT
jgi:hypothetical protein